MKIVFCLVLICCLSADHTSKFFRKILASHDEKYHSSSSARERFDEFLSKDLMPKNMERPQNKRLAMLSSRRRSFVESLKTRVIKTELEAMVDNLSGGPGFHAKRHTYDEFHETKSFDTRQTFKDFVANYDIMKSIQNIEEKKRNKSTKSPNFRLKSFRQFHRFA